jgi:hypothetical protein
MRTTIRYSIAIIAMAGLLSCKKTTQSSPREEQQQTEIKQPLLSNEILEQEGLRFTLNYQQTDAQLSMKLYEGTGEKLVEIPIVAEQAYVNYTIEAATLKENSDFTLVVEFKNVVTSGTGSVTVIGFTDINNNKNFTVSGIAFSAGNNQTSKAILKIHKGIRKFGFYQL